MTTERRRRPARLGWRLRVATELVRSAVPMLLIESSLRRHPLPRTCLLAGVRHDLDSANPVTLGPVTLSRQQRAGVRAARLLVSRWPAGDTCLRQCLLIGYRLRRRDPVLRIGVRRDERGVFQAHSWLEFAGLALDPQAAGYATLGSTQGSGS